MKGIGGDFAKLGKGIGTVAKDAGGNFAKLGKGVASVASKAALGGLGLLAAGAVGVGAGIAASVKEGAAFTKQMSAVGAISGAVPSEMELLTKTAKEMGATTAFSGTQAAEGMQFLAQAGFEVKDIVQALPGVLDLAAASGTDLGSSADIVSNIVSGFGATADETGKFVDILTNTFTTSNVNLEQLGESMKFAAPVAKGLGQSIEVTAASIGILGNAGLQGATAGEKFRAILSRLANPTKAASEELDKLGVSVFNSSGEMRPFPDLLKEIGIATEGMTQEQKNAALATLFTSENAGAFQILLAEGNSITEEGQQKLAQYSQELLTSGTAATVASKQLDNLSGDVTLFQSAVSGVKLDVFDAIGPLFRIIVQAGTDLVGFLPELIEGFNFQELAQTLEPRLQALVDFLKAKIPLAIKSVTGFWTNILLPAMRDVWSFLQTNIFPVFKNLVEIAKKVLPSALSTASTFFTGVLVPALRVAASFLFGTVIPAFVKLGTWIAERLPEWIRVASNTIVNFATKTLPKLREFADMAKQRFEEFKESAKQRFEEFKESAKQRFDEFRTETLPKIVSFVTQAVMKFRDFRDKAVAWFEDFRAKAQPIIESFTERFQEVWEQAGPIIIESLIRIGEAFSDIIAIFGDGATSADSASAAADTLGFVLNAIVGAVKGITFLFQGLAFAMESIAKAAKITIGNVDNFGKILKGVGRALPEFLKLGSPPPLAIAFSDIGSAASTSRAEVSRFGQSLQNTAGALPTFLSTGETPLARALDDVALAAIQSRQQISSLGQSLRSLEVSGSSAFENLIKGVNVFKTEAFKLEQAEDVEIGTETLARSTNEIFEALKLARQFEGGQADFGEAQDILVSKFGGGEDLGLQKAVFEALQGLGDFGDIEKLNVEGLQNLVAGLVRAGELKVDEGRLQSSGELATEAIAAQQERFAQAAADALRGENVTNALANTFEAIRSSFTGGAAVTDDTIKNIIEDTFGSQTDFTNIIADVINADREQLSRDIGFSEILGGNFGLDQFSEIINAGLNESSRIAATSGVAEAARVAEASRVAETDRIAEAARAARAAENDTMVSSLLESAFEQFGDAVMTTSSLVDSAEVLIEGSDLGQNVIPNLFRDFFGSVDATSVLGEAGNVLFNSLEDFAEEGLANFFDESFNLSAFIDRVTGQDNNTSNVSNTSMNLTINSSAPTDNLSADFAMMQSSLAVV